MATEILDLRRTDERNTYLQHPVWFESAAITKEADDKAAILMDFNPDKASGYIIHDIYCKIVTPFVGGTVQLNVGRHTIPTVASTTGDTATIVDIDDFIASSDITEGTAGIYYPTTGDFVTAKAAGANLDPVTPPVVAASVQCLSAELSSDAVITAGEARVYALISFLP